MNLVETIVHTVKEASDDVDTSKPFGVVSTGGSIGSNSGPNVIMGKGRLVKTFDDEGDAKAYAKRMRKLLSPGEKKHYGMSYKFIELTPNILKAMSR